MKRIYRLVFLTLPLLFPPPVSAQLKSLSKDEKVSDLLPQLNPITTGINTFTDAINAFLPYFFVLSGLVLFVMLISGGFEMLTSATNPDQAEKGKQRITNALLGFIVIFIAYWLTQAFEIMLGIKILD